MNHTKFDETLRSACPTIMEPEGLNAKIDEAIRLHTRHRTLRRRIALSFALTSTTVCVLVAMPAIQAQAALNRLAGALDGVKTVLMTKEGVDEDGGRFPAGSIAYDQGRWRFDEGGGRVSYYLNGRSYTLDESVGAFVLRDQPEGPFGHNPRSMRMSDLIRSEEGAGWNSRATVEPATLNGRSLRQVTIENGNLPERTVFFADPKTDLPLEIHLESKELGRWRLRQVISFAFGKSIDRSLFQPDFERFPAITEKQADERLVRSMTSASLATMPLKQGRLVIRAFDVASDGTVFVAYQSGDRSPNSWKGFALELRDDAGTRYLRREVFCDRGEAFVRESKDGKMEVEVFVPAKPIRFSALRTFTIGSRKFKNGTLARMIQAATIYGDGREVGRWQPNYQGNDHSAPGFHVLMRRTLGAPTCLYKPAYADKVAYQGYGLDIRAQMTVAGIRGRHFLETKQWTKAVRWLEEELRLMRLHERQGYGVWSQGATKEMIAKARSELGEP